MKTFVQWLEAVDSYRIYINTGNREQLVYVNDFLSWDKARKAGEQVKSQVGKTAKVYIKSMATGEKIEV